MSEFEFSKNSACPFCDIEDRIIIREQLWVAIEDAFPVNTGHTLIITRRHVASFRDITREEFSGLYEILHVVTERLDRLYKPAGYNFGVNDGDIAGQTVFHVHFHVIPRYEGDDPNPRGGVRRVKQSIVRYDK
jgi:diadenosine tetraphosphate (Ap4A) HIT family hydrolase